MTEIKEVGELKEWERVSAHSHIQGLGLNKKGKAEESADGMVGQKSAREAAGIIVKLIEEGKFAGRSILIAGPPGTGKTALALGISRELGNDVPFVPFAASEIFSTEMKKTEFLTQTLRKAIGVRIHDMRKIYEGVVKKLDIETSSSPMNPYQKIPSSATITVATNKEKKTLSMDQAFAMQFSKKGISEGDIVQIDADGGKITKLGKSSEYAKKEKLDLSSDKTVPVPEGEVFKEKEFVYTLTLHQMDMVNARRGGGGDIFSMLLSSSRSKEIDSELRKAIDDNVKKMVKTGKAEIMPGVVFIDECSLLDIETFAFLNRAMEEDLAPIIIFATNRGITEIRGTTIKAPHGMPIDLLDRILIMNTKKYTDKEINKIIKERCKVEDIEVDEEALELLTKLGAKNSLRYAIQLLAPSRELANKKKIKKSHVKKASELFIDVEESVEYLKKMEKELLE